MHYIKITNSEGKQWILPTRNMRVGLMLYQPSAWKGKVIKKALPFFNLNPNLNPNLNLNPNVNLNLNPDGKLGDIIQKLGLGLRLALNTDIEGWDEVDCYLEEKLREKNLEFSVFMGTPSANQKITVQVFKGKRILGYCKLTRSERIYGLFLGEKDTLDRLETAGIGNIPHCIDCRKLENGYYAFLQSTKKTVRSTVSHELDERHYEFVKQLAEKTAVNIPYKESDFGKMMVLLREHLDAFDSKDREALARALDKVDDYYKDKTTYCTYHGDFTPWNTCNVDGELFVFDWEYAAKSCPPYMDLMHFVGQVGLLEKNSNEMQKLRNAEATKHCITKMLRLSHLLYILAEYSELFDWHWPEGDRSYVAWMKEINDNVNLNPNLNTDI